MPLNSKSLPLTPLHVFAIPLKGVMIQQRHHLNSSQSMKHRKRNESGRQDGPLCPPFRGKSLSVFGGVGREARSMGCGSLRRKCHAGLITLWVPYYVSSCHFQFEPPHCSGGPRFFPLYLCFDWGSIVTRLKLVVHSKQRRRHFTAGKNHDHMFTISIGLSVDGRYVCVSGGWGNRSHWPLHTESHVYSYSYLPFELMSCVSSSNLPHWLTWKPCRKPEGKRAAGLCRKSLCSHSAPWAGHIEEIQTDNREREGRRGYGMGEQGVSSVKANCSPIEWNDSEELVEVGSFECKRLKHLGDWVEIPHFYTPECLFLQLFRPSSSEQSLSSLSLSLLTSLHLSVSHSISSSVSIQ